MTAHRDDGPLAAGARTPVERGDQLAAAGDLAGAEAAYREADEAGEAQGSTKLGLILESLGRRDEALEAYARADERGDGRGAFRRGMLLSRQDRWDEAQAAWARAEDRGMELAGLDLERELRRRGGRPAKPAPPPRGLSALGNPVLVGAMTVLVVLVAVFLAYNANGGLPFVPTTELKVDVGSGSDLVAGDEVSEGGYHVGIVTSLAPVKLRSGQVAAQVTLALDKGYGRVPVDSRVEIRPRSVLGLKYVDLTVGRSHRYFPDGSTLPIVQTSVPVQFEDVFEMFDTRTRSAIDQNLVGFGDALAGRGSDLNDTIASLPRLLYYLRPVAQYLAAPSTELTRLFDGLERFVGAVAPVAGTNARLFTDMATTFAAIAQRPQNLEQTIAESPSTEQVSTRSLQVQRPFLADLNTLGTQLAPATQELRLALPDINPAIEAGTRTLARTPLLDG